MIDFFHATKNFISSFNEAICCHFQNSEKIFFFVEIFETSDLLIKIFLEDV